MNTWLRRTQAELEAATTFETQLQFARQHPFLFAMGLIWAIGQRIARLVFWLLVLALLVVGLKCLWLVVSWLWRLI